jgi:hypothetical protein
MSDDSFDWVNKHEAQKEEERSKDYFNINEGDNRFVLLSHFAPLAQIFDPSTKRYKIAEEGEKGASIKGVCWVAQKDGEDWYVKSAKMPYTVVKMVRDLRDNEDWDFQIPFPHPLNLKATGAGTKEVEYSLQPSPKEVEIPQDVLKVLSEKPTPEEIVEKMKENAKADSEADKKFDGYPEEEINPEDIPF